LASRANKTSGANTFTSEIALYMTCAYRAILVSWARNCAVFTTVSFLAGADSLFTSRLSYVLRKELAGTGWSCIVWSCIVLHCVLHHLLWLILGSFAACACRADKGTPSMA